MCRVSVVIPYYNREKVLERALDSVCEQTFQDLEIILVNDGSTDRSAAIVEKYIQSHQGIQFKHISQTNMGPSGARNTGIRSSQGQYIAFLDSDDSWEPAKLKTQIEYMEENPHIAITGTNYFIVKDQQRVRYPLKPDIIEPDFYHILFKVFFATPTIVVRREIFFEDNIWYREGKHRGEDHLFYMQLLRQHRGIRFSQPLANTYKLEYGEEGLTKDLHKLWECDRDNLNIIYAANDQSHLKISIRLFLFLKLYLLLKHIKRMLRTIGYRYRSRIGSPTGMKDESYHEIQ